MAVQFDEPTFSSARKTGRRASFITGLFLKIGLVKTEEGAKLLMLIVLIVAVALSALLFARSSVTVEPPSADEVIVE